MDVSVSCRKMLCVFAFVTSLNQPAFSQQSETLVSTGYGELKGIVDEGSVSFRGIPYAKPPVGALRWQPPETPDSWQGVRDARRYSKPCPQSASLKIPGTHAVEGKEDCLYLNVWTPREKTQSSLPVMVFVHGGGFASGSGVGFGPLDSVYTGEKFAPSAQVVMVTFNYRIGALGYFAEPSLSAESDTGVSGNYGLQDQIAALQWVREEIAHFGGDPQNVTVFGESAGAMSICSLLAQQKDTRLFHKAIMQSGSCQARTMEDQLQRGVAQAKRWGCDKEDAAEQVACLRAVPLKKIIKHQDHFSIMSFRKKPGAMLEFAPVVDGQVLTEMPLAGLAKRREAIPTIIGNNHEEFPHFTFADVLTEKSYRKTLRRTGFQDNEMESVERFYHKKTLGSYARAAASLGRDIQFTCPGREIRDALRQNPDAPVYGYVFNMPLRQWMDGIAGVFHGLDVLFLFQKLKFKDAMHFGIDREKKVSAMLTEMWSSFAHTGEPRSSSLQWQPETGEEKLQAMLSDTPELIRDFQAAPCEQLQQLSVRVQHL